MQWQQVLAVNTLRFCRNELIRVPFQMQFLDTDPEIIAAERKQAEERAATNREQSAKKTRNWLGRRRRNSFAAPLTSVFVNVEQLIPDGKFVLTCGYHKVLQLREMTE